MAEIVRLTPEIDWENNDEFYPIDLRGAITVFGRTKRGRPVCITFTESGHDLQFDSGQIHNSFSLKVLKDIGTTLWNLSATENRCCIISGSGCSFWNNTPEWGNRPKNQAL